MKIIASSVLLAAFCLVTLLAIQNQAASKIPRPSPETVVANLYKQHNKATPFFQTRSRALLDKYFDKQLADLLWKDANTNRDEVGPLDGDPLYNAQDTQIKNFVVGKGVIKNKTAQVKVSFINFDRKEEIVFDLVSTTAGWKVANLTYGDGSTLVGILKQDSSSIVPESGSRDHS